MNLELPVIETKQETPTIKTIRVGLNQKLDFKPGQYIMMELDEENVHPLSIASSPTEGFLLF